VKTFIVDSFTTQAFRGNPAGVCFPSEKLTEEKMLSIAMELGLSETAFILPTEIEYVYSIRYFSPKKEIPLCGHATLASAKVIFRDSNLQELRFHTIENIELIISRRAAEIVMEFPVYETIVATISPATLEALGLKTVSQIAYSPNNKIILLEIESAELLASLNPDYNALLKTQSDINGVLVTARSGDKEFDYHYRYFWPWAGTNEDPVTGGVQTFLAKYWSEKIGKTSMKAYQSSARTGHMNVEIRNGKVFILCQAVIMFEGNLIGVD
jgi:PhzF family phenazine biosynthesis protein